MSHFPLKKSYNQKTQKRSRALSAVGVPESSKFLIKIGSFSSNVKKGKNGDTIHKGIIDIS